ncbi:stage V sporulation protein AE [Hathewaya proteolytica DSM 3090]|uniref:Stage V sporulation protein AE n=2 Tax=Hathewaya proteolytica TaxID=29365 RepID=A0A1M6P9X4_9CLOT|nr:stage V sporulation protein AE [Hathewaya proteolytica DSM 3090]
MIMDFIKVFIVGGLICVIAQILMDTTKLTPARILVVFVVLGTILGAFGWYDKLVEFAGAGATIPLPGFGNVLANGVIEEVKEAGFLGIFTGGTKGAAAGIASAIVFGYIMSIIFNAKTKE